MPALGRAGIKKVVNGPFTFGPDGNPLIGPVPGLKNYWTAVGVMAGFCQGGGVGLCMAEWIDQWRAQHRCLGHGCRPLRRLRDPRLGHHQIDARIIRAASS